jgi:N-acetylglucosaminyldiphosphoundecaprenol N-acetyl-beta-D-mannosaminyltransferase
MRSTDGDRIAILGVRIDLVGYGDVLARADRLLAAGQPGVITYSHFHTILDARRDALVRGVLAASDLNHPDGIGVAWAARLLTGRQVRRMNGTDLYPVLIRHLHETRRSMYFLGGERGSADALEAALRSSLGAAAALAFHHGDIAVDDEAVPAAVAASAPDVLFLGLGSPKQYRWLARHQAALRVPLVVVIGGGIEFLSGVRPRAPRWMRAAGLEWAHRLLREPGHVWKRYIAGIPRFAIAVLWQKIAGWEK